MKFLRGTVKNGVTLMLRFKPHNIQYMRILKDNVFIGLKFENDSKVREAVKAFEQPKERIDMPSPCAMALEELK